MTAGGDAIAIVAMGANTPLGADAWSSAAAVRAGISGFTQHPYMIDTAGEPMRVAYVQAIDIGVTGADRFEDLLVPAIDQALEPLAQQGPPGAPIPRLRLALALALPPAREGQPEAVVAELVQRIKQRLRTTFGAVATFTGGHAAGLIALQAACAKLQQGAVDACVVAGVDTYMEPETLEWLEACDQLHGAGPLNNAWGFIPGEAGAALLLMPERQARARGMDVLGRVLGTGTGFEAKRIKTETVCIGEGLTAAFRNALAVLPSGVKVTDVYCDMNGEPYRADEYGFTALRTKEAFESASDFVAPADCWGDVAAAGALLHLQLACAAAHKGYANGPLAFAWASAEGGERAASVIATAARS